MSSEAKNVLLDGSRLIIEALARAGADVFIGYPITPANLLYLYGSQRFPAALAAPDEITTLQWMSGFAAAGKIPVTATSFPGYALMVESINMAYMMELPMVIVLSQRLGPSTGTATLGAQGDLLMLQGTISGGYPLPTLSIASIADCWTMAAKALYWAVSLRSPVVLLTAKDDVMTSRNFDLASLETIEPVNYQWYRGEETYQSYLPQENLVPAFLPVGNKGHRVRLTASTHDSAGILQNSTPEALANTKRLQAKLEKNLPEYTHYELDEDADAKTLVFSYGITAQAAREAVTTMRSEGKAVSYLIAKTLFPTPPQYHDILAKYEHIVVAEENLNGQMKQILFGTRPRPGVTGVNAIARLITPEEIIQEVKNHGPYIS
jgi:2-oxoglutarate ferredoxin oxidoreductase subunit alpha